ncbi:MAG: hypothetical protein HW377_2820 [Actinobacteria bacterium]|nr:hypothetical protein [Actinomycetota bacterium]
MRRTEGHTVPQGALRLVLRQGVEVAPVVELGEGVRDRLAPQLLLEGLAVRDVPQDGRLDPLAADDLLRQRELDRDLRAGLRQDQDLDVPAFVPRPQPGGVHGELLPVVGEPGDEQPDRLHPEERFFAVPEKLLRGTVGHHHLSVLSHADDGVPGGLEDPPEPLLGFEELRLEGDPGGDVGEESDVADLLSVFPEDGAAQANGGLLPVLPQDLRLEVHEVTVRAVLRGVDVIPHLLRSAGRVQKLGVQLADDFFRRVPEDPFRALVVKEDVSPRVVRDDPFRAGRDHVFEESGSALEGAQEGGRGICGGIHGRFAFHAISWILARCFLTALHFLWTMLPIVYSFNDVRSENSPELPGASLR